MDSSDNNIKIVYDNCNYDKNKNGTVQLSNPYIQQMDCDYLYHLNLNTKTHDFEAMFGDVKFVCMGGTGKRMKEFAEYVAKELNINEPLVDLAESGHRYHMYKVGPVISVSHGMGISSLSILMHEIIKLLYHAKCSDVTLFRIGTSGGLGVPPGTVVITEQAVDELLQPYQELKILGKIVRRSAQLDQDLVHQLKHLAASNGDQSYKTVSGKTICALDFYESQTRLDGAICDYTHEDKMKYIKYLTQKGVVNIEMECVLFAAMCCRANIPGAIVCVTLVNRCDGDQVNVIKEDYEEFQVRPQRLVLDFIKHKLGLIKN